MKCPICANVTDAKYRPFCSKRCADVDLARWFNGSYSTSSEGSDSWSDDETPTRERDLH